MKCLKCGQEVQDDQAFCPGCLEEMARYPVNPGTVALLPTPARQTAPKKTPARKRPVYTPEEQVTRLKKRLWGLRILVLILVLLVGGMSVVASRAISELDIQRLLGQNYSTVETDPEPTEITKPPLP